MIYFDYKKLCTQISSLEEEMSSEDFWNDTQKAQKTSKELNKVKNSLAIYEELKGKSDDLTEYLLLLEDEDDKEVIEEFEQGLKELQESIDKAELIALLDGPYDTNNAIVSIHPGAGGTESQDWAEMLLRMYTRWAENKKYSVTFWDYQSDPEAGIKEATFLVSGDNSYGYLKAESGVHRLVRISPFDASGKRHTSFASVDVLPEIDDEVNIEINNEDLRIDTYRASGAGGQHVNKTESAVRITHLPTGIVVQCQNQRSQHSNKATAMRLLKAKLYERQMQEQEDHLAKIKGDTGEIAWGNQIRSYVLHPYKLVKDHRSGVESQQVEAVLAGHLEEFLEAPIV